MRWTARIHILWKQAKWRGFHHNLVTGWHCFWFIAGRNQVRFSDGSQVKHSEECTYLGGIFDTKCEHSCRDYQQNSFRYGNLEESWHGLERSMLFVKKQTFAVSRQYVKQGESPWLDIFLDKTMIILFELLPLQRASAAPIEVLHRRVGRPRKQWTFESLKITWSKIWTDHSDFVASSTQLERIHEAAINQQIWNNFFMFLTRFHLDFDTSRC